MLLVSAPPVSTPVSDPPTSAGTGNRNALVVFNAGATTVPVSLLKSGQFLALSPQCTGGLILDKGFYADFVCPGNAVGGYFDLRCEAVYAVGMVEFCAPEAHRERQQAYQKRISTLSQLQETVLEPTSLRRAHAILRQIHQWIGSVELNQVPHHLLAKLAGVRPETIALAWCQCLAQSRRRRAQVKSGSLA